MLSNRTHPPALIAGALAWTEPKGVAHLPGVAETLRIDQFARQQFVAEFTLAKEQWARGCFFQLPFKTPHLFLGQFKEPLPDLQLGDHPLRHRRENLLPGAPAPPTPPHRHGPLQKKAAPIACIRRICRHNCSRRRPCARRASSSGEGIRTILSALWCPARYSLSRRQITRASCLSLT